MFTRPTPIVPEIATTISSPLPKQPRVNWGRVLKRGVAFVLVATGVLAMLSDAGHVVTENAVISAQIISLRSPVDGVLQDATGKVGATLQSGAHLAAVENPRIDERPASIAGQTVSRLKAQLISAREERAALRVLLDDLERRAERYKQAITNRLGLQAATAQRQLASKLVSLDLARRELRRKQALAGTIAQADIERAQAAVDGIEQEAEALSRTLVSDENMTTWAADGVLAEPGSSADVAYSVQRADEVRLRLSTVERDIGNLTAAENEAQDRLAVETQVFERTRKATIRAPGDGTIWRIRASKGEQVSAGDVIAELVDCRSAFLAAAVPQKRLPDIQVGGAATIRLSGERGERVGRVRGVMGESAMRTEAQLAAVPMNGSRPLGLVLVDLPQAGASGDACLVGRTAHVILPTDNRSWIHSVVKSVPGLDEGIDFISEMIQRL
jgi:multidrug resistance efflux pump